VNNYDLKTAETLVSEYGCDARDAILVATAIESSCPIFVTEDQRLKRKLRHFKKIGIVKTETLVNQLKAMPLPTFYMASRD
jgi:predicted nucleic acid-binding protein